MILETIKPAENGSGDIILRLYESKHADTRITLSTSLPVLRASMCGMLEDEGPIIKIIDGTMALHAGLFKVIMVRLYLH